MADDPDRPLSGRGALYGTHLEWDRFLCRLGGDGTSRNAFVARNFILDEGVWPERAASYHALRAVADHGDYTLWKKRHSSYLGERIHRAHSEEPLDPHDKDICPETFRFPDRHTPFDSTDRDLHLIRLESAKTIAGLIKVELSKLLAVANEALANRSSPAWATLEDHLLKWFGNKDGRPVYCGFYGDLEEDLAADRWADALRDRLGLAHFDPGETGGPIDILVFKYPVSQVSRLAGAASHTRPLVPPTVLDGDFSEAFCPAPAGGLTGHVVNLDWDDLEERRLRNAALRREVLHPKTRLQAKHLFRVGRIEKPVDFENLPLARAAHLEQVRAASGRADYALGTDKDLH